MYFTQLTYFAQLAGRQMGESLRSQIERRFPDTHASRHLRNRRSGLNLSDGGGDLLIRKRDFLIAVLLFGTATVTPISNYACTAFLRGRPIHLMRRALNEHYVSLKGRKIYRFAQRPFTSIVGVKVIATVKS